MGLAIVTLLNLSGLEVRWAAPPSCPAPEWSALASEGRVEALVTMKEGSSWVLDLNFLAPFVASRHLELTSCAETKAAARALILLGLRGRSGFVEAELPPSAPPLEQVPLELARKPVLVARLSALASAFGLPGVTPRFLLGAALRLGSLEVGVTARFGLPARYASGPTEAAAVEVWPSLGGEFSLCWTPRLGSGQAPALGRFHLGACLNALLEWWQLSGMGVSDPRGGSAALLGLGPEGRISLELAPHLEVGLFIAPRLHLLRPAATFAGVSALAAGPVSIEGGGGLLFSF